MDDERREKEAMRNQMIAFVLMIIVLFVSMKWLTPPQNRTTPATAQQQTAVPSAPGSPVPPVATSDVPGTSAPEQPSLAELPEVPTITDPAAEEVSLKSEKLDLTFTRIGARLKQANVFLSTKKGDTIDLVPVEKVPDTETKLPDTEAVYPLGLRFTDPKINDLIDQRRFEVEKDPSGKALTFSLTIPDNFMVRKRFAVDDLTHVLTVQVDIQNLKTQPQMMGMDQTPAYYLNWGPDVASGDKTLGLGQSFVWRKTGRVEEIATTSMKPGNDGSVFEKEVPEAEWAAVKSSYFVVALKLDNTETALAWTSGDPARFRFGLGAPRFEMAPNAIQSNTFSVYIGPSEQKTLTEGWKTLPSIFRFFQPPWTIMDWFAKLLLRILNWFYMVIPNYGLGIILLTVLVRLGMYPLTLKSMKSMKKMQMLGPELEELKAKHANDPQALNAKMMELYKERGVNPLGGCLPMLLQMPVFIALYRMLWCSFELRGASFLWISDLSLEEKLIHLPWMAQIPLIGQTFEYINILPVLMGVAMVFSQKMMPNTSAMPNQQQKVMMIFMPIFFSFICYKMAAGLNLYILTSTILGMVQQHFTSVSDTEMKAKKTVGKRQHFYTAAKARQRQRERESKNEKRRGE